MQLYTGSTSGLPCRRSEEKQYKLIMDEQGLLPKGKVFKAEKKNCDNREFSFAYPLEAYGVGIFTY